MTTPVPPTAPYSATPDRAPFGTPLSPDLAARLGEAGLKLVPHQPTRRMLEAGRLAGNGDPALAAAIFAAMLDAAD